MGSSLHCRLNQVSTWTRCGTCFLIEGQQEKQKKWTMPFQPWRLSYSASASVIHCIVHWHGSYGALAWCCCIGVGVVWCIGWCIDMAVARCVALYGASAWLSYGASAWPSFGASAWPLYGASAWASYGRMVHWRGRQMVSYGSSGRSYRMVHRHGVSYVRVYLHSRKERLEEKTQGVYSTVF